MTAGDDPATCSIHRTTGTPLFWPEILDLSMLVPSCIKNPTPRLRAEAKLAPGQVINSAIRWIARGHSGPPP